MNTTNTENVPDVESTALFADWWSETGSGLTPLPSEDTSEHVERVARLAFEAGANRITREAVEMNFHSPDDDGHGTF